MIFLHYNNFYKSNFIKQISTKEKYIPETPNALKKKQIINYIKWQQRNNWKALQNDKEDKNSMRYNITDTRTAFINSK